LGSSGQMSVARAAWDRAYKEGWNACLDELQRRMSETFLKSIEKILKE
jgi:hypothetical protein